MTWEIVKGEALEEMSRLIARGVKVGMCLTDPPLLPLLWLATAFWQAVLRLGKR